MIDEEIKTQIDESIKQYFNTGSFTDIKRTDTPTDANQVVPKKYVDDNFTPLTFFTGSVLSVANGGTGSSTPLGAQSNLGINPTAYFGNGVDGDVTISVNSVLGTYKFYNNLTIDSGKSLRSAYPIYVKETLTVNGALHNDGNNGGHSSMATAGVGGNSVLAGFFAGASAGKDGATGKTIIGTVEGGVNGTAGANEANCITGAGVAGGDSGEIPTIIGPATGGAGGSASSSPTVSPQAFPYVFTLYDQTATKIIGNPGSGSGASGSGRSIYHASFDYGIYAGGGGGSGSNGGDLVIFARNIVVGANGRISCNGGNGGNGGDARYLNDNNNNATRGAGGGGGGAGGSGGILAVFYHSLVNNGSILSSGGSGGNGGAYWVGGGVTATNGSNGSSGNTGFTYLLQV